VKKLDLIHLFDIVGEKYIQRPS